jgi:hypothetical protein
MARVTSVRQPEKAMARSCSLKRQLDAVTADLKAALEQLQVASHRSTKYSQELAATREKLRATEAVLDISRSTNIRCVKYTRYENQIAALKAKMACKESAHAKALNKARDALAKAHSDASSHAAQTLAGPRTINALPSSTGGSATALSALGDTPTTCREASTRMDGCDCAGTPCSKQVGREPADTHSSVEVLSAESLLTHSEQDRATNGSEHADTSNTEACNRGKECDEESMLGPCIQTAIRALACSQPDILATNLSGTSTTGSGCPKLGANAKSTGSMLDIGCHQVCCWKAAPRCRTAERLCHAEVTSGLPPTHNSILP